ncbi:leucine-rich repeat-containing protein 24-like [Melanotaenia boesemani]|uniref:leucine-rich repeat-containing protein 24-like n=1 Tax=Melanotaenia boesemani TaxID=1250792 RepID=UPI001C04FAB2|nr:leucine-rich repeat-containing protein 24-like [Melanotaenia boesemani]
MNPPQSPKGNVADVGSSQQNFDPGYQTLILTLSNVGEINSAALQSSNLASITRLSINNAGITGIAENAFSSFLNLRNLSLGGNMLSQINTNWFANPAALRELTLTHNLVEVVNESTVNRLTNLTKLILNKNRIKHVHPNSFSSQSLLAELDLSENRLSWVSPQVFRSLRSLRSIGLDRNPWNCSCDHKDFVDSIKELKSRSQLERPMDVTCETPPPLKGQPVWNVSVCPVLPPSVMSTYPTTDPTSTGTFEASSLSGTETSVHPKPTNTPVTPSKTTGPPGGFESPHILDI